MIQHMVEYDAGGDRKTLVGGWWTGGDFNTSRHARSNGQSDAGADAVSHLGRPLSFQGDHSLTDCGA